MLREFLLLYASHTGSDNSRSVFSPDPDLNSWCSILTEVASNLDGLPVSSNPRFVPHVKHLCSAAGVVHIRHRNFNVKHELRSCRGKQQHMSPMSYSNNSFSDCTLGMFYKLQWTAEEGEVIGSKRQNHVRAGT